MIFMVYGFQEVIYEFKMRDINSSVYSLLSCQCAKHYFSFVCVCVHVCKNLHFTYFFNLTLSFFQLSHT